MRLKLLPGALEDIREIWDFGCDNWGEARADAYSDVLDAAIKALVDNPAKAPRAEHVKPGLRRLVVGSHAVFYNIDGDTLEVLHGSRDAGRWV